ncbi:uncharacterized protein F5Z01DRAFT_320699 [Emericellopsis atlantica]|uniref:Uncharacterized protein n=1 Tax=Emericellopsis atlantica TaxID=2614577 RepID=A0A9P7ZUW4_9HYPO|nr:uncharacterized protein F5Z01DRAFT_320699 [Emericellopsis atlantica]KAG9258140.1 hypothetical protein F5Z01DRAFT_320699 [Emericellopsis atlantica]
MPGANVEQTVKSLQRLREPIIFCKALSRSCETTSVRTDSSVPTPLSEHELFQKFVYKIALVCDNQLSPDSITAVSVMEDDDVYWFLFACNKVTHEGGSLVAEHIISLLRVVRDGASQDVSSTVMRHKMLERILLFNRPNVQRYIKWMIYWASDLWDAADQALGKDAQLRERICKVVSCVYISDLDQSTDEEYLESCFASFRAMGLFLKGLKTFPSGPFGKKSSWGELKHCFSRLHAYRDAANCIADAATRWPNLFEHFKVHHVPSSRPKSLPTGKRSYTSHDIVGRMSNDSSEIRVLREKAASFLRCGLDEAIEQEAKKAKSLNVHCEVLLEDWIAHSPEAKRLSFFRGGQGWKYIGASKPTCRLCKYYFAAKRSDIALRPSHENLYTNWLFPESHGSKNTPQGRQWQTTLNSFMQMIRDDAIRMLNERTAHWKKHDSNTYATPSVRSIPSEAALIAPGYGRKQRVLVSLPSRAKVAVIKEEDMEEGGVKLK